MRVTWITFAHNYTSAGVIANNVIIELTKLGIDVGYHALNNNELNENNIKTFPPEVQVALKKGHREDSIGIFFSYPDIYATVRCKVNVGYTGADSSGWYSTSCPKLPHEMCNEYMDYMLTPADYSRQIMKNCGTTIPIELFPHGLNTNLFKPFKRKYKDPFTFVYTGELSERKGTQDLIKVFKSLYSNDPRYQLLLRANSHMQYYGGDEISNLCKDCSNIKLVWENKGQEDLIYNYFNQANVYVYPTKADWFGMTPFESLSTGCPTIATKTNGYHEFLKDYVIDLDYYEEEIGNKHPYLMGKWNHPDLNELERVMKLVVNRENYEKIAEWSFDNSFKLLKEFTWKNVTQKYLIPFLNELDEKHFKKKQKGSNVVENKKVTVGIPTKDRPVELSMLLQSLLSQTYKDFDVLIVDDWMPGTLYANTTIQGLIKLLKELNHNVIIIPGERKGPHIAGQKILDNSQTELILRLDDDVVLKSTFIETLVNTISNENTAAVGPIYLNPHEPLKSQVIDPKTPKEYMENQGKVFWDENNNLFLVGWLNINMHPTDTPIKVEHLNSGFMYKKSIAKKMGGYCLDFSPVGHREESDFSYRLFREGFNLYVDPKAIAFHFHPMSGGIRETSGVMLSKSNWDRDEKIFLERMEKILPKNKKSIEDRFVSVVILTHGTNHDNLRELLKGISTYTNHPCEYIVFNNDISQESIDDVMNIKNIEFPNLKLNVEIPNKELAVSTARNQAVKECDPNSKYICFIDDDARIVGRYNQVTDWLDYLYNRFHEEVDTGVVSPIVTWCDYFQCYVASVACLFTSRKVWEVVGGFDQVFGSKLKETWGYEDTDWSYRCVSKGFKIVRVKGREFPFYHQDTSEKAKSPEIEKALLKAKEILDAKYDFNEIKKFNRTVYPLTEQQMNYTGTKLNVGCYYMYLDGFTNIDIKNDVNADLVCNALDLDKYFKPNSVDLILSSHMLEHLNLEDGKKVMKLWYDLLIPNGCLVLEVPNCENLDDKVEKGILTNEQKFVSENGIPQEFGQKHLAQYTPQLLISMFKEVGFRVAQFNPDTSLGTNSPVAVRFDCFK